MKLRRNRYTNHAENRRHIAVEWKLLSYSTLLEENTMSSKLPHYNSAKRNHCFLTSIVRRHISTALNGNECCFPVEQSLVIPTNAITDKSGTSSRHRKIYILVFCFQAKKRMSTWSTHKSRRIQLSHEACGMNSVSNEAWPRWLVDVLLRIVYYFRSRRQSFQ